MNSLTTFTFENHVAHGAVVRLRAGVSELFGNREYSESVRDLLSQALVAMPLFATHLNFEGRINLQFQALPETRSIRKAKTDLLVAQIDHELNVRAMAKAPPDLEGTFQEMLLGGVLALMVEPRESGRPSSQALVLIEGEKLQNALEHYFARSEQLPTFIRLAVRGDELAAFMLQRMPLESSEGNEADWEHLRILAQTVKDEELLADDAEQLLNKLFIDAPPIRMFEPREITVRCNCDRAGISRLLISLGQEEVESILAEQGNVAVTCEFCGLDYAFDKKEAIELFKAADLPTPDTRH